MAPVVLLLEDSEQLRFILTSLIAQRLSVECLALDSVASLHAERDQALACHLAILDINLGAGKPGGLEAYNWLMREGYAGKIFFLTGHAVAHPQVAATLDTGVEILEKPLATETLLSLVQEALDASMASFR